jgi:hypothetical protein
VRSAKRFGGVLQTLGTVAVCSLASIYFLHASKLPSTEFLLALAGIGASLFLAYVIEIAWMVPRVDPTSGGYDYDAWLGYVTGFALAGLIGIGLALAASEQVRQGDEGLFEEIALGWAACSLAWLGFMVAMQPIITDMWGRRRSGSGEPDTDLDP